MPRSTTPLRLPVLLGQRAFRRMALVPAVVLIAVAAGQLIYLVGPDLPNPELWRKVGFVFLVLALVAVISPVAVIAIAMASVGGVGRAWAIRACDVVMDAESARLVGGPAHGFVLPYAKLAEDGVERTDEALRLRGVDRAGEPGWLTIPWPSDQDERASLEAVADTLEARAGRRPSSPERVGPPESPRCPGCGAPIAPSADPRVTCGFCGAVHELPADLAEKVRATALVADRRRRDARLVRSLMRQRSAHAANVAAFALGALISAGCALTLFVSAGLAFSDGLEAGLPRLAGLPLVMIGLALAAWALAHAWLSNRRALRVLTLGFSALAPRRAGEPHRCRSCGAGLPAARPDDAIATCVFCRAPSLLTADWRVEAAQIERLGAGESDPWALVARSRRRRRTALVLGALGVAAFGAGLLWLREDAARGALADTAHATPIEYEPLERAPITETWDVVDGVGTVEARVCFELGLDVHLARVDGGVDAIVAGTVGAVRVHDLASDRPRQEELPIALSAVAVSRGELALATSRGIEWLERPDAPPLHASEGDDPIIVDLTGDGDALWLTTRRSRHGHLRVRRLPREGGRAAPLVEDAREPALAPGGGRLAFAQDVDGRWQVVVAPYRDGAIGARRLVTTGEGHVAFPTWSPDAEALLVLTRPVRDAIHYSQFRGRAHLFIVPLDGGDALRLTEGASLDLSRPIWEPGAIWFVAWSDTIPLQRCVWRLALDDALRARFE